MKKSSGGATRRRGASAGDSRRVFSALKNVLKPYAGRLRVMTDKPRYYYLETRAASFRGKPVCFGAVRAGKAYVSFYLMPIYMQPSLAKGISPELKRRKQGKSCFNFTSPDPALFRELAKLTAAGFGLYRTRKLL